MNMQSFLNVTQWDVYLSMFKKEVLLIFRSEETKMYYSSQIKPVEAKLLFFLSPVT